MWLGPPKLMGPPSSRLCLVDGSVVKHLGALEWGFFSTPLLLLILSLFAFLPVSVSHFKTAARLASSLLSFLDAFLLLLGGIGLCCIPLYLE